MGSQQPLPLALLQLLLLLRSPNNHYDKLPFDRIFQFGDSISDIGNLRWDDPTSPCGKFPYGMSLGGLASNRCSDGQLMIDYFAQYFGLPINPYLEKGADFGHGVNFAVAGSTALDFSVLSGKDIPMPYTNSSLNVQLNWFKSYLSSLCSNVTECKEKVQNALIIVGEIGGNDFNFAMMRGKSMEELHKMVPDVIQVIKVAAEELINLGAIRMIIPGNFPIGCSPIYLAMFEAKHDPNLYDELRCLTPLNDFAKFYNSRLLEAIKELQQKHSHVTIVYADYFNALRWVIKRAPSLGFDKDGIQKVCCGIGKNEYNFDATRMCGHEGTPVCVDPNKRISWDGIHFTQHAYQRMANWLLQHIVPKILATNALQVV